MCGEGTLALPPGVEEGTKPPPRLCHTILTLESVGVFPISASLRSQGDRKGSPLLYHASAWQARVESGRSLAVALVEGLKFTPMGSPRLYTGLSRRCVV